jgi:UDP-glucose 4-epimerase
MMDAPDLSSSRATGPVVVLGGLGFMGSHISRALVARGFGVRIFDRLYASRAAVRDIESTVEIVEGDIARSSDVLAALEGAETIIHLVHTTVPGSSMDDPAYDVTSNVAASAAWLARLAETTVRRILYVSSGGTVYGVPRENPIREDHPTDPVSSYGITKLAIEKYVAMYASMHGVAYRILRPSNVYGAGQRLHIGQGVVGVMIQRALHGEPLEVWGTGESLRDYLHVDDLVAAVSALVSYEGTHNVFNISGGRGTSVNGIIEALRRHLGSHLEVVKKSARAFDVPANVLDSSRLTRETGWRPAVDLEDGIARTIDWLREQQAHERQTQDQSSRDPHETE